MSRWFRFYDNALDDPKVQRLAAPLFKTWVNLLCVASRNSGALPSLTDLAWTLRIEEDSLSEQLAKLKEAGLLDECEGGLSPHNWDERQYQSDSSAERMRRHRSAKKAQASDVTGTQASDVTVTPQNRTEADTETEEKKNREEADAAQDADHRPPFVFKSGVIRLNASDFDSWTKAFPNINLEAELRSLTEWAGKQGKNWFMPVSAALAKRDREARLAVERVRAEVAAMAAAPSSELAHREKMRRWL